MRGHARVLREAQHARPLAPDPESHRTNPSLQFPLAKRSLPLLGAVLPRTPFDPSSAGEAQVDLSLDVMEELMAWRAERQPASPDEYVFATTSGRPRDKENISRRVLGPAVERVNEVRAERGLPPLPKVTPHALRRTYISLMFEAGAPLPYVMHQVGHADARTTLEIYAQVQQRLSRKQVHRAFDDLLASSGSTGAIEVPTGAIDKMSQLTGDPEALGDAETTPSEGSVGPRGPRSGPRK